jgi:hypothetical protein
MSRPTHSRSVAIAACVLAPWTAACPLPIAHTESLSAPVAGVLRRSDGTPLPGAVVAVSPEDRDSTCANAALRTTTDSAGTFQLPAFQKRYSVVWLIPNLDRAAPSYSLCAGADTLRTAYHGYGSLGDLAPPLDSLACLEWAWLGRARVTCSGSVERAVVTRGRWTAGDAIGWYRIISTLEAGRRDDRPRVFVQWVARAGSGTRDTVVGMVELPLGKAVWRATAGVEQGVAGWCANVVATRKTLTGWEPASFRFALGPPGETRPVGAC